LQQIALVSDTVLGDMASRLQVLVALAAIVTAHAAEQGGDDPVVVTNKIPGGVVKTMTWSSGDALPTGSVENAADDALKMAMGAAKGALNDPASHAPATLKTAEQLKDAVKAAMPKIEAHGNMKDGNGMPLKITFGNAQEQATPVSYKAAAAEYLAMTLFVVIGCGSAMAVCGEPGWVLQVALTFGLAITSLAYTVGHFSGGQINCAVTLGLVLAGKLTAAQGVTNFVAQILGSLTGALLLTLMIPEAADKTGGLGTNKISDKLSKFNAFVGEFIMTFLLMFVVLETAVNPATKANREMAALAIGFAVFLAHAVLINVDGCSINPTRTFGPAMVRQMLYKNKADSLDEQLVFWAGPLLGAAGAVAISTAMR
jgi:MIP family channel proteins